MSFGAFEQQFQSDPRGADFLNAMNNLGQGFGGQGQQAAGQNQSIQSRIQAGVGLIKEVTDEDIQGAIDSAFHYYQLGKQREGAPQQQGQWGNFGF